MEPQRESKSSVEITRTAKGDTVFVVKVYRDPGQEEEAAAVALERYTALQAEFYPTLTPTV